MRRWRHKLVENHALLAWTLLVMTWAGIVAWLGASAVASGSAMASLPPQVRERYAKDEHVTDMEVLTRSDVLTALWAERSLAWSDATTQVTEEVLIDTEAGYTVTMSIDREERQPSVVIMTPGGGSMSVGAADGSTEAIMVPATGPHAGEMLHDADFSGLFEPVGRPGDG